MAKVPTERVTVRLNKQHLNTIDALIQMGELRNRTHAISEAVKDYLKTKAPSYKQIEESAKSNLGVQAMAAQLTQLQEQIAKLSKK